MTKPCVVFATPGLIPLESFTTFGVNSKPNSSNPFGYFGTGLKYAIAVCLRMNQEVVLWRGRDKYTFFLKTSDFRDKQFDFVRMKLEKRTVRGLFGAPKYERLPFTTELGKNWELWQAFRELETNTRDEEGETFISSGEEPQDNQTMICVYGARFIDEFHDKDRNFLPDGKVVREDEAIQVLDRPSKHIYYRGVRVMDLKHESEYTYNFLRHIDLTEDRTVKYPFLIDSYLAGLIIESDDEEFVQRTVQAPSHRYEAHISFGYSASSKVSAPFQKLGRDSTNPTARELWNRQDPTVPSTVRIVITVPRSEITDDEIEQVRSAVADVLGIDVEVRDMAEAA